MSVYAPADIAQVCHEANRAVQIITGDPAVSPHWDEAPDWQKDSAIEGVVLAQEGNSAERLHDGWCNTKVREGWVYGTVKDPDADPPTHPCLVHYDKLPPEQKIKDTVFGAIVEALS